LLAVLDDLTANASVSVERVRRKMASDKQIDNTFLKAILKDILELKARWDA